MPQTVQVEGVGDIEFPDSFSQPQIQGLIDRDYPLLLSRAGQPQLAQQVIQRQAVATAPPPSTLESLGGVATQLLRGVPDVALQATRYFERPIVAGLSALGMEPVRDASVTAPVESFLQGLLPLAGETSLPRTIAGYAGNLAGFILPSLIPGVGGPIGTGLLFGSLGENTVQRELARQAREGEERDMLWAYYKSLPVASVGTLLAGLIGPGRVISGPKPLIDLETRALTQPSVAAEIARQGVFGAGYGATTSGLEQGVVEGRISPEEVGAAALAGGLGQAAAGGLFQALRNRQSQAIYDQWINSMITPPILRPRPYYGFVESTIVPPETPPFRPMLAETAGGIPLPGGGGTYLSSLGSVGVPRIPLTRLPEFTATGAPERAAYAAELERIAGLGVPRGTLQTVGQEIGGAPDVVIQNLLSQALAQRVGQRQEEIAAMSPEQRGALEMLLRAAAARATVAPGAAPEPPLIQPVTIRPAIGLGAQLPPGAAEEPETRPVGRLQIGGQQIGITPEAFIENLSQAVQNRIQLAQQRQENLASMAPWMRGAAELVSRQQEPLPPAPAPEPPEPPLIQPAAAITPTEGRQVYGPEAQRGLRGPVPQGTQPGGTVSKQKGRTKKAPPSRILQAPEVEWGLPVAKLQELGKRYVDLGWEQRGEPESLGTVPEKSAVFNATGSYTYATEHVGDLIHRLTGTQFEPGGMAVDESYGREASLNKINSVLQWVDTYSTVVPEELRRNYDYRKARGQTDLTFEQFKKAFDDAGKKYAQSYRDLKPVSIFQHLARDAAVALGEQNYPLLKDKLVQLKTALEAPDWKAQYYKEVAPTKPAPPLPPPTKPEVPGAVLRGTRVSKENAPAVLQALNAYYTETNPATKTQRLSDLANTLGVPPEIAARVGEIMQEVGAPPSAERLPGLLNRSLNQAGREAGLVFSSPVAEPGTRVNTDEIFGAPTSTGTFDVIPALETLAKLHPDLAPLINDFIEYLSDGRIPLRIQFYSGLGAAYSPASFTMYVGRDPQSGTIPINQLFHEVGHAVTVHLLRKAGIDPNATGKAYLASLQKVRDDPNTNPLVKEFIDLYLEAVDKFGHTELLFGENGIANTPEANAMVAEGLLPYGVLNIEEFAAEGKTNPEFQRLLDGEKDAKGKSLWQRFLDWLKKLFPSLFKKPILDRFMEAFRGVAEHQAVQGMVGAFEKGTPGPAVRAPEPFKSAAEVTELVSRPDVPLESQRAITGAAGAQASLGEPGVLARIAGYSGRNPRTPEGKAFGSLAAIHQMLTVSAAQPLSSLPPQDVSMGANLMTKLHGHISMLRDQKEEALAQANAAFAAAAAEMPKVQAKEMLRDYVKTLSEDTTDDFVEYLREKEKLTPGFEAALTSELARAGLKITDKQSIANSLFTILRDLAAAIPNPRSLNTAQIITEAQRMAATPPGFGITNKKRLDLLVNGLAGADPLLARLTNLPSTLHRIKTITTNEAATAAKVEALKHAFHGTAPPVNAKPITLRQYNAKMKRLAELHDEADEYVKEMNRDYANKKLNAEALDIEVKDLSEILDSPTYKARIQEAVDVQNMRSKGLVQMLPYGMRFVDPIDPAAEPFDVTYVPGEAAHNANRTSMEKGIRRYQTFLSNPNIDPVQRAEAQEALEQLAEMWADQVDRPEDITMRGTSVRRFLKSLPILSYGKTLRELAYETMGRNAGALSRAMTGLDILNGKINNVGEHPDHGVHAQLVALTYALESHGKEFTPENVLWYERNIGDPLADSMAAHGAAVLQVDKSPSPGVVLTKQDVALFKKQIAFEHAIGELSEKDAARYGIPSRIQDEIGMGKTSREVQRMRVTYGLGQVTRTFSPVAKRFVKDIWDPTPPGSRQAILEQDQHFHDYVLPYVAETNTDYNRQSKYEVALRKVAQDMRNNIWPSDWDELVDAVISKYPPPSPGVPDTRPTRSDVRRFLGEEVAGYLDSFSKAVNAEDRALTTAMSEAIASKDYQSIQKMMAVSLKTEGSFISPRGHMVGPYSVYEYSRLTPQRMRAVAANAMNVARARVVEHLEAFRGALEKAYSEVEQAAKLSFSRRKPGQAPTQKQLEKESAALRNAGKIRWTLSELDRLNRELTTERQQYMNAVNRDHEAINGNLDRGIRLARNLTGNALLASAPSQVANVLDALLLNPILHEGLFRRSLGHFALAHVTGPPTSMARSGRELLILMARKIPGLKQILPQLMKMIPALQEGVQDQLGMIDRLKQMGVWQEFDIKNRWSLANRGGISLLSPNPQGQPNWLIKGLQYLSTYVGSPLAYAAPRMVDAFANLVNGMGDLRLLLYYSSFAKEIGDVRVKAGKTLDPADPTQQIKPEEMNLTPFGMANLRKAFAPLGGLEKVMFDYYNALKASRNPAAVPFVDENSLQVWLHGMALRGNVLAETNTPLAYRKNTLAAVLSQFMSFPMNRIDQYTSAFGWPAKEGGVKGALKTLPYMAIFGLTILLLGMLINAGRQTTREIVTGAATAEPTITGFLKEPSFGDAARLAGMGAAQTLPIIGSTLARIAGGGSTRPVLDASAIIPLAGLAADLGDTASSLLQQGPSVDRISQFVTRWAPFSAPILNRLPGLEEAQAARNVLRTLRSAAPSSVELRPFTGGRAGGRASPISVDLQGVERAAFAGDKAEATRRLQGAIAKLTPTLGEKEARRRVVAAVRGRSPEARVFGRKLTPVERESLQRRLTSGQRDIIARGQRAQQIINEAIPAAPKGPKKARKVKGAKPKVVRAPRAARLPTLTPTRQAKFKIPGQKKPRQLRSQQQAFAV